MIQNWLTIFKWLLIMGGAITALVIVQHIIDLIRGKKSGLQCPACGAKKFEHISLNDEIKNEKPTRSYRPVRFHINHLRNISVEPFMRDTIIWPYKTGVICRKCGARVKTYSGNCDPVVKQRTNCPKCNSLNYSRNINKNSNISGMKTEGLQVWGQWTETCPDCGYSETHKFFHEFSPSDIPDKPKPVRQSSSAPAVSSSGNGQSKKWRPKQFSITYNGSSYTLTQRSMYSEIDYVDNEGHGWSRHGGSFRPD